MHAQLASLLAARRASDVLSAFHRQRAGASAARIDALTYNFAVRAAIMTDDPSGALVLYDEQLRGGVRPTPGTMAAVLTVARKMRDLTRANDVCRTAQRLGLPESASLANTMVSVLLDAGAGLQAALRYWRERVQASEPGRRVSFSPHAERHLLGVAIARQDVAAAMEVFTHIVRARAEMPGGLVPRLLALVSEHGSAQDALAVVRFVRSAQLSLASPALVSLMRCAARNADAQLLDGAWRELTGAQANATANGAVSAGAVDADLLLGDAGRTRLVALARCGRYHDCWLQLAAMHGYDAQLSRCDGALRDVARALAAPAALDAAAASARDAVASVLEASASGTPAGRGSVTESFMPAFNVLVLAAAEAGHLDRAVDLLSSMERVLQRAPDVVTYNALLHGCLRRGRSKSALSVLEQMRAAHVAPNAGTLTLVVLSAVADGDVDLAASLLEGDKLAAGAAGTASSSTRSSAARPEAAAYWAVAALAETLKRVPVRAHVLALASARGFEPPNALLGVRGREGV